MSTPGPASAPRPDAPLIAPAFSAPPQIATAPAVVNPAALAAAVLPRVDPGVATAMTDADIATAAPPLPSTATVAASAGPAPLQHPAFAPATDPLPQQGTTATATGIAQQIAARIAPTSAAHFATAGGGGFDLALSPEELGSVRLRLISSEAGSILIVQTERPETLELMRRHVGTLEHELRTLGHESLSVRFSGSGFSGNGFGQSPNGSQAGPHSQATPTERTPPDSPSSAPNHASPGGPLTIRDDHLDLRL